MTRILLLDTNVFSAVLRGTSPIHARLRRELALGATALVSPVVYYELRRGLLKRGASRDIQELDGLLATLTWADVTRGDWDAAARLWVTTQRVGRPRGDADLVIAAQANRRGAVIVTDNVKHFKDVANAMETWS